MYRIDKSMYKVWKEEQKKKMNSTANLFLIVVVFLGIVFSCTAEKGPNIKDEILMNKFISFVGNDADLTKQFLNEHPNFETLIVKDGVDANMKKTTALLEASKRGHVRVVEELLKAGADITVTDHVNRSPIHFAAICTKQHLYRHGICPEELHYKGEEDDSHFKTMEVLLNHIDFTSLHKLIDQGDENGRTAIMYAVMQDHDDVIQPLLEHGADLSRIDNDGWHVVLYGALYNRFQLLNKFFSNDDYDLNHELVNVPGNMGYSPLVIAAEQGWENTVRILLSYGANPTFLCRDKKYPYEHAKDKGHNEIAVLLKEKYDEFNARKDDL